MSIPGSNPPPIRKLPFWIADVILLAAATALVVYGPRPLTLWQMVAVAACAALGGWFSVLPVLREYEASLHFEETDRLAETAAKLGQLEDVASRIAHATAEWQGIQERAGRTTTVAQEIVDRLTRDAEAFATAVSRTSDGEKQTLKLEVEKLRKGEVEWVQSVARLMDHVFSLHVAALHSGQQGLIDQIERFHAACRDALRRVGFIPLVAAPDEPFDPRKHHAADGSRPAEGTRINETVGPGYVYQGKLVRPIAVTLLGAAGETASGEDAPDGPAAEPPATTVVSHASAPPVPGDDDADRPEHGSPLGVS